MSSMTPQGQCRLAPLITLIQDSNPLYDVCVRIMFKLHDHLPNDLLTGHRERFRELFVKLKQFYDNSRPLQYFADLIQVPHLPDNVPNFSSKVDFDFYIPPVVLVQPDPEPAMEQLIDTDNNSSSNSMTPTPTSTVSHDEIAQLEMTSASEEKFRRLKTMYTQMRDEHVNLLRQHDDTAKQLTKEKNVNTELLEEMEKLRQSKEIETTELCALKMRLTENVQNVKEKSEDLKQYIQKVITNYVELEVKAIEKEAFFTEKIINQLREKDALLLTIREHDANDAKQLQRVTQLEKDLEIEKNEKDLLATQLQSTQLESHKISEALSILEAQNAQLHGNSFKTNELLHQMQTEVETMKLEKDLNDNLLATLRRTVLDAVAQAMQQNQGQLNVYAQALQNIDFLEGLLAKLHSAAEQPTELLQQAVLMGQQLAQLQLQGTVINNTAADIQMGQMIYEEISSMATPVKCLCAALQHVNTETATASNEQEIKKLQEILNKLQKQLLHLKSNAEAKSDVGDMVQNELADMDKAIAEATQRFIELLSATRSNDEGIKLEVNVKILDACTALMECIKQLIERARNLQEEIVTTGRGSTSVKEFYKRNSQWTEGLISAAKSVAKGANLLLDAADKATSFDVPTSSEYFHILVAAQEIAACTAQLVVASKVKAPKNSERLSALQQASRSVSHATGAVVATVRDCNKYLEQPERIDITKLTSSQAKTMEMEIHVRVLELEQALQMERQKLTSFRRDNYLKTED